MAINIQEILHPSDSDSIKFEKINYNFDQIVANGGGPSGQKGNQGLQGVKGNVGAKGQKGEIGPQGLTGATTSRWKVITVNPNSNDATYSVLKPKLETDNLHPTIFLGDQSFNENTQADGWTTLRATLTIGKHAQGTNNEDSDELLRLWHGQSNLGNNVSVDIQSTNLSSNNDVRYRFGTSYDVNIAETTELYIDFDKFTVDPDTVFKVPVTAAVQTAETGLIRYNSGTNTFQGGVEDVNNQITWTDFCMAPCGQGSGAVYSITIDPDTDLLLNEFGSPSGNAVSFSPAGDVEVDNTGNTWSGAATTTTTTTTGAPSYTLVLGGNPSTIAASGGSAAVSYTTGPTTGLILDSSHVQSAPSWATFASANGTSITFTVASHTGSARSGTITLEHPNDSSITDSFTISQSAYVAPACTSTGSSITLSNFAFDPVGQIITGDIAITMDTWSSNAIAHVDVSGSGSGGFDVHGSALLVNPASSQLGPGLTVNGTFSIDDDQWNEGDTVALTGRLYLCSDQQAITTPSYSIDVPAPAYTSLIANPTTTVDEGQSLTLTLNGTNIPNGTQVWVSATGGGIAEADFSGWQAGGSGDPYGGSTTSSYTPGVMLTMNNNTATVTVGVIADEAQEGVETAEFYVFATDSAGNSTAGAGTDSVGIMDTSASYMATAYPGVTQYGACTNNSVYPFSASYDGTTYDMITQLVAAAGSNNYFKVSSDGGPNSANHIDHVFQTTGGSNQSGVACSGVTTTTVAQTRTYSFHNGDSQSHHYFYWNPVTALGQTSSPLGSGQSRNECAMDGENGSGYEPYWCDASGNPVIPSGGGSTIYPTPISPC